MSRTRFILVLLVCGQLWLTPTGFAADEKPAPAAAATADAGGVIYPRGANTPADPAAGRSGGYTTVLIAALLMAGAGAWLFWRGRGAPGRAAAVRKLAIAETKSLGNRQYLVVASYENKKFLLGVCPGRIDLLTPLDASATTEFPRT